MKLQITPFTNFQVAWIQVTTYTQYKKSAMSAAVM